MATADFIENRFWHSMMDSATTLGAAARVSVDPSDARAHVLRVGGDDGDGATLIIIWTSWLALVYPPSYLM